MATQVSATYKKNTVVGEVLQGEGKPRLKILSWTLDSEKPAPKTAADGFVGVTFDSINKAGHEGMGAIRKYLKLSPLPNNYIVFFENGSSRPFATRDFVSNGSKPTAKAKAAPKAKATPKTKTAKAEVAAKVTAPKVAANATGKSGKVATKPAVTRGKSKATSATVAKRGRPKASEPEELDI